ncbi:MAG: ABC transporter permease [Caldilineaceae bacterium SB0661_bin_32]|uniref:ABC transporter permease n=1 Tax=Caldilineaceae bacterium SB0661_bin_32 TaxID=2605255 RepID=A0A6B1D4M5_9CHLR|nr:ABC transporter permease [Caldilineaceae bacterium SB0661_bin_32]
MSRFLGRRLIRAVLTVWAVGTLVFFLMHALPGDVVLVLLDTVGAGSPAADKMREFLGLDRPLHVQYFDWLGNLLRGDMGNSLLGGYPVWDLVKSRIPVTVELAVLTILLGLSIAIPLGIVAAARNGSWIDLLAMQFGQLGISIPNFWIATILILVVAARLQWLPPSGYKPISDGLGTNLLHMIMPSLSLALPLAAVMTRVVRSAVLEVLNRDYMRVAHAKGLHPQRVLWRHGLRNAAIPIVTVIGLELGYLLGGTVLIEEMFFVPGLGQLTVRALLNRDLPVLQGVLLLYSTAFVFVNLVVDLLYGQLDPRIRYE